MTKPLFGEIWKQVAFDFDYTHKIRIEISNYGRVRSFSKLSDGRILKYDMVRGYKIIHLKFLKERDEKSQTRLKFLRSEISEQFKFIEKLNSQLKLKKLMDDEYYKLLNEYDANSEKLEKMRISYRKELKTIENKRSQNFAGLIHRWVAEYFIEKPSPEHNLVAHLDYNKLNNLVSNLTWMTRAENVAHNKKNPNVIAALEKRKTKKPNEDSKVYKLTSTKVMLIKKKINNGVPLRKLAKVFKVTETQLLRIKRGENWGYVKAAK